jgi:hypothetical protein
VDGYALILLFKLSQVKIQRGVTGLCIYESCLLEPAAVGFSVELGIILQGIVQFGHDRDGQLDRIAIGQFGNTQIGHINDPLPMAAAPDPCGR